MPMKAKKDPFREAYARREKAEKLIASGKVQLRPPTTRTSFFLRPPCELKTYEVVFRGEVIGKVEQVEQAMYRKAGRLISHSWHRRAWAYTGHYPGLYCASRKRALVELMEKHLEMK